MGIIKYGSVMQPLNERYQVLDWLLKWLSPSLGILIWLLRATLGASC